MVTHNRVIIDTDPGIDDVLAMLLAFASKPEELEVLLISLTFGNIDVQSCLQNAVSLFHVIEKEFEWRRNNGRTEGFEALKAYKPIIAIGAHEPLDEQQLKEDCFHGVDGLGGVHKSLPHLNPAETWHKLFEPLSGQSELASQAGSLDGSVTETSFIPSRQPAHKEMLRLLRENEPGTISIIAIGPLTNLALAAAEDAETFLRAKEVVVMGGAINVQGNVSPVAEFNTCADAVASARVFALTSAYPRSTLPRAIRVNGYIIAEPKYPAYLPNPLKLTLFPLDITTRHRLKPSVFQKKIESLVEAGSPLAEWMNVFVTYAFNRMKSLYPTRKGDECTLGLHDPMCIWYALSSSLPGWKLSEESPEDIRIETTGQWTRGMHVIDRRGKKLTSTTAVDGEGNLIGDPDGWLSPKKGNRVWRVVDSPDRDGFGAFLLDRIFA